MKKHIEILMILFVVIFCLSLTYYSSSKDSRDKGIGPVKSLQLGPLDHAMAMKGKNIFNSKCTVCHSLYDKKIGPPLGKVASEQSQEYIMNLLLNTAEMLNKDDRAKQLVAQFKVPMPPPNLSKDDARAVLEYLRATSEGKNN